MSRLSGAAALTASGDTTIMTAATGGASARVTVMNRDTVPHVYNFKIDDVEVDRSPSVPAGEKWIFGPENVTAGKTVKVTTPATTTNASTYNLTGEDDA